MGGRLYLLGGRRPGPVASLLSEGRRPVNAYDPATKTWSEGAEPPLELHHFQAVAYDDRIWVVGALSGAYPGEVPVPNIWIYDPAVDEWSEGPEIPADRRRGAGGVAVRGGKIYMAGGIVDGHNGGFKNWFDEYDPEADVWRILPGAPRPRDHFQAAIVGDRLYAVGGRTTSKRTGRVFELTVNEVDVYDFGLGEWSTLESPRLNLPTPRAGAFTVAAGGHVIVGGGESAAQSAAHAEVEAFNVTTQTWTKLAPLVRGRHGFGAAVFGGKIYVCAGSGNRGGSPELSSLEEFSWEGR